MSSVFYLATENHKSKARERAPLKKVSVTALIRDSVAEYTLTQTFLNPRHDTAVEAVYTFPLHDGVAVTGFEAEVAGREIVGRVQERDVARKEYNNAVRAGKLASLLEQERPDVFQASIGNVPRGQEIRIRLSLVAEIKHDTEGNQVRFVLPTAIAPRYGKSHVSASNVDSSASKLSVKIRCVMSKPIISIQSPSHTIQFYPGGERGGHEPNLASVSLTADALLDKDLVVIVESQDLHLPIASMEIHPRDGTRAVSLTFAPRYTLHPLPASELIFLVDRSGSMRGSQITQAGEALELFLRSIPHEKHWFNVVGFGTTHKALFPKSVPYDADSLKKGISYARHLRADMGKTKLTSAFEEALHHRRRNVPTQIFLVSDGEVWDVDSLVKVVRKAVEEGEKSSSFVRVFSLGVGASVFHNLIESVARAGGGSAQVVVKGERMEKKVMNMLKAARMPPFTHLSVRWADDSVKLVVVVPSHKYSINLFDESPEVAAPPRPPAVHVVIPIQQAPFKAPALNPSVRFTMYAILSPKTTALKKLIVQGHTRDGGHVDSRVEVNSRPDGETLHALAARALVRDLEEGSSIIHALGRKATGKRLQEVQVTTEDGKKYKDLPLSSHLVSELTKQKILELALKYNLSSKHTSWVAIDKKSRRRIIQDVEGVVVGPKAGKMSIPASGTHVGGASGHVPSVTMSLGPTHPQHPVATAACQGRLSISSAVARVSLGEKIHGSPGDNEGAGLSSGDPHAQLRSILQHQQFDGLFSLDSALAALFSTTVTDLQDKLARLQKAKGLTVSETVWTTCLAVELMRKQLPELHEEWELVVEKAETRVAALVKNAKDLAALRQAARDMAQHCR